MRCSDVEALWDELRGCEEGRDEPVFAHLRSCLSCREIFRLNDKMLAIFSYLRETTPPEDFCAKILEHIKNACSPCEGLAYLTEVDSPLGKLMIAFTNDEKISYLGIAGNECPTLFKQRIEGRLHRGLCTVGAPEWLNAMIRTFFTDWTVDHDRLDTSSLTPFECAALHATTRIPLGEVRSYGWVATTIGRPQAARAVGQTMARNPLALLLPCHRVVDATGSLHHYAYGLELKARILRLEGYTGNSRTKRRIQKNALA